MILDDGIEDHWLGRKVESDLPMPGFDFSAVETDDLCFLLPAGDGVHSLRVLERTILEDL